MQFAGAEGPVGCPRASSITRRAGAGNKTFTLSLPVPVRGPSGQLWRCSSSATGPWSPAYAWPHPSQPWRRPEKSSGARSGGLASSTTRKSHTCKETVQCSGVAQRYQEIQTDISQRKRCNQAKNWSCR